MARSTRTLVAIIGAGVGFVLLVLCLLYGFPLGRTNRAALNSFEKTKTIEVTDYEFKPKTAAVKIGDKVTWKNTGTQSHTVTFRFISKNLYPGEAWSWTIDRGTFSPGENLYGCEFHRGKGMDGASLVVTE